MKMIKLNLPQSYMFTKNKTKSTY